MFTKKISNPNTMVKIYHLFSKHDQFLKNTIMINLKHYHKITLNKKQIFFHVNDSVQEIEFENENTAEIEFYNIHNTLDSCYKNIQL